MRTPSLVEYKNSNQEFRNPQWTNEDGEEFETGRIEFVVTTLPSRGLKLFGEKDFTEADDENLRNALQNDLDIDLHKEFLANAQTSARNGKLSRAILEMVIACEIAVKRAFFAKSTTAGAAYEYLEDKGRIRVSVIELIHNVAKEAVGQSFKDVDSDAYQDIDYLFRARNKVAHRGVMMYRDVGGTECEVDRPTLEVWWASVDTLISWIDKTLM